MLSGRVGRPSDGGYKTKDRRLKGSSIVTVKLSELLTVSIGFGAFILKSNPGFMLAGPVVNIPASVNPSITFSATVSHCKNIVVVAETGVKSCIRYLEDGGLYKIRLVKSKGSVDV